VDQAKQPELIRERDNESVTTEVEEIETHPRVAEIATQPRVQERPPSVAPTTTNKESTYSPPARNTRSQTRTVTQEIMLQMIDINFPCFLAKQAASRKYPKEVLAAVLNHDTGELMEYRHLIAEPKYRKIWKPAYGK
jgi:hypothetical protein